MATIAALGTGVMGAPMARNLARAGHDVRAWTRSPEKAQALRDDGVDVCDDPASAATGADVVLTMLADADAVLDVARQAGLAQGQIWWQASTIGLAGTEQCDALASETGVALVDAPVLSSGSSSSSKRSSRSSRPAWPSGSTTTTARWTTCARVTGSGSVGMVVGFPCHRAPNG